VPNFYLVTFKELGFLRNCGVVFRLGIVFGLFKSSLWTKRGIFIGKLNVDFKGFGLEKKV